MVLKLLPRVACITTVLFTVVNCAAQRTSVAMDSQGLQAVSATGSLPVYGIDLRIDKSWDTPPPGSPGDFARPGESPVLQRIWSSLKPRGFNTLRVDVFADDSASVNRIANLCSWAKNNDVKLVLVLRVALNNSGADNSVKFGALVQSLISQLQQSAHPESYFQIAAYQLGDELNFPRRGLVTPAALQQLILQGAASVRAAERELLSGTGRPATPLMVSVSFDYELIQVRAIAGAPLNHEV